MGSYGFCVGPRDYSGNLKPRLHPRRLLDGIIEGVRDGGNKSGIPTTLGMTIDLFQLPFEEPLRDDQALFSESAGRFIVTVSADNEQAFESLMLKAETQSSTIDFDCIGKTTEEAGFLEIQGQSKDMLLCLSIAELKTAWKKPFGALI